MKNPHEAREAQIAVLNKKTMQTLRWCCCIRDLPARPHDRKMDLILLLINEHPRQKGT